MTIDDDVVRLTDFRMAGFLLARGVKFQGAVTNDRGDVEFAFDNLRQASGETAEDVLDLYPGSAEQRYDASCRAMHDRVRTVLNRNRR